MYKTISYLKEIISHLKKYRNNDQDFEFIINSKIDSFKLSEYDICIDGIVYLLEKLFNRKLISLDRTYLKKTLECNDCCKKNHILVQTEQGDQNSKICLDYLLAM